MRTARVLGCVVGLIVLVNAFWIGCGQAPEQPRSKPTKPPATANNDQQNPSQAGKPDDSKQPPKLSMPQVVLTEADQQTCLVKIGDMMPQAELPDPSGKTHALAQLFGPKLTVLCFWSAGNTPEQQSRAVDVLEFLQLEVAGAFPEQVRVIGVNVGDNPQTIAELLTKASVQFVTLLDSQGTLFARVATQRLPRVYLLDAQGKILWFDMELRRISRQDLLTAIRVSLGEGG